MGGPLLINRERNPSPDPGKGAFLFYQQEPETIDRFRILKVLGKGAQGKVYLAEDTRLKRNVAIKTLLLENSTAHEQDIQTLLDEAHTVSHLQHPHIVALHDAGEQDGTPYLVFEFVEGITLANLIKGKKRLMPAQAVGFAIEILKGIGYAHQQGVIHRDLKPANVVIDEKGTARIMDFGIASRMSSGKVENAVYFGTPLYMAPEYVSAKVFSPQSDIYAAGMILYEMLTGQAAIKGSSVYEIFYKVINETLLPPSQLRDELDERLDDIVMRALAKEPDRRYRTAEDMLIALKDYLLSKQGIALSGDSKQVALDFLMLKMRHKSDFPALSRTIGVINRMRHSEQQNAADLANVVLKDFALTNKLLKMVNTIYYQQFGGKISTVSRAVTILGFETVGNAAISLMLFANMQNRAQADHLKDEAVAAFFSGILARHLAIEVGMQEAEEVFICAMLRKLGKMLVMFYFPEEYGEIEKQADKGVDEEDAAATVLGLSYEEIGVGVAKNWSYPDRIIYSMCHRTSGNAAFSASEEDEKLRHLADMANELCRVMRHTLPMEQECLLDKMKAAFGEHFEITREQISRVVGAAVKDLLKEAAVLNVDLMKSSFFAHVSAWSKAAGQVFKLLSDASDEGSAVAKSCGQADTVNILNTGILDITNKLVSNHKINDVMHTILETIYRSLGFSRVLLCAVDPSVNTMRGRFGFGREIDSFATKFHFPMAGEASLFHEALQLGDYLLEPDLGADSLKGKIPNWYRKLAAAKGLLLLPLVVNKKPLGMIYADYEKTGKMNISAHELALLLSLRNQAVLAIEKIVRMSHTGGRVLAINSQPVHGHVHERRDGEHGQYASPSASGRR